MLDTIDSNVNSAVDLITAIYQDAGKCMLVNFRYFSSQPPWWDDECDYLKSVKYIALRKFRSSNLESDLRLFKDKRNNFKNHCRSKVYEYQRLNRQELVNCSNNHTMFWKLKKKVNQPNQLTLVSQK